MSWLSYFRSRETFILVKGYIRTLLSFNVYFGSDHTNGRSESETKQRFIELGKNLKNWRVLGPDTKESYGTY